MRLRTGLAFCVAVALAPGCRTGQGATAPVAVGPLAEAAASYAAFEAGQLLPPGRVVGRVVMLERGAFRPAPQVVVRLDEAAAGAPTASDGGFGFDHVPPGVHRVSVVAPGSLPMAVAFRLGGLAGLGRVNLVLVPEAGSGEDGAITLAGVATDPRGAALPGATVRIADSLTAAGNASTVANAEGAWAITLPAARRGPLVSGIASLSCHGRTPGGVAVEATEVTSLALGGEAAQAVVAGTRAFGVPEGLRWEMVSGRRGRIVGQGLPTRRDEVVVRVALAAGPLELLPLQAGPDGLTVELPGAGEAPRRLEVLPLGLVPAGGEPPGLALP